MEEDRAKFKVVVRNRKARHDYHVTDTYEAGIELRGSEVKSIRNGKVQMADSYALVEDGQVILKNLHISPYEQTGQHAGHDPVRPRRLLLHKREIRKLKAKTEQQGMTLIPLSIYFRGKVAKVELGLAVGRKKYDKREAKAKAEAERRMQQATKRDLKQ